MYDIPVRRFLLFRSKNEVPVCSGQTCDLLLKKVPLSNYHHTQL